MEYVIFETETDTVFCGKGHLGKEKVMKNLSTPAEALIETLNCFSMY